MRGAPWPGRQERTKDAMGDERQAVLQNRESGVTGVGFACKGRSDGEIGGGCSEKKRGMERAAHPQERARKERMRTRERQGKSAKTNKRKIQQI